MKQRNANKIKAIVELMFNYDFTNRLLHIESNLNSSSNDDNLYLTCRADVNYYFKAKLSFIIAKLDAKAGLARCYYTYDNSYCKL